jgi:hypothetical protein
LLAFLAQLGLGQLELLMNQSGGLLGELLEQVTNRALAKVAEAV